MIYREKIASMKCQTFSDANKRAINIYNDQKDPIGKLIPVGKWILEDTNKIELIASWRQKAMKMFLAQFDSTFSKTHAYLSKMSVDQEDRLFFLIYDQNNRFIGHIGISRVDGISGELDNLMRGVDGGDPRLIYFSEVTLLDWCFKNLKIVESYAVIVSYNWLVQALHEQIGYVVLKNFPLRKLEKNGASFHDEVDSENSNVSYSKTKLFLTIFSFYEKNPWIK